MDRLEAMHVFCKVVECGNFASAAQQLAYSTSAVSRCVAQLENHLNVRLLNRTTRRLSLTESGQAYFERCSQWLTELAEIEAATSEQATVPRGLLKITTSIEFGMSYLAPVLTAFRADYPHVHFNVMLSGRRVDLVEAGIDLAIRIGPIGSSQCVARKVGSTRLLVLASPAYLNTHTPITTPQDLSNHACLSYEHEPVFRVWHFQNADRNTIEVKVQGPIQSDHSPFLFEMAAQGLGIARAPCFIARPYLQDQRLVRILNGFEPPELPIHALYPSRKHLSAKVRMFIRFLENYGITNMNPAQ